MVDISSKYDASFIRLVQWQLDLHPDIPTELSSMTLGGAEFEEKDRKAIGTIYDALGLGTWRLLADMSRKYNVYLFAKLVQFELAESTEARNGSGSI